MIDNMILLIIIEEKERKKKKKYYDIGRIDKCYWIKCYGIKRILRKFIE